ncbi:YolD-like family protein [Sporosarcina sp. JAI121]|uniref:YolD-like family protein n=1 Tax=Sporosarcina sp. JAI121 TaxID=2723064 RepID=UPI0015CB0D13|nr:YolD-like family protein [Sporosarcina sp. JAI121]NYF23408.1 hypothetical protein [Sporosarcina sp. JAI121]
MTAIPKPKASRSGGIQGPKLTKTDYLEIGERIGESIEFGVKVEVMVFAHKRYDSYTGVVKGVEDRRGLLSLQMGYENINMNNIVSVK